MANGSVSDAIAADYLAKFDRPLSVSAVKKLQQFPVLQELGYNGQLSHLKENFHGLKEFNVHMDMYSMTNWMLRAAWAVIKNLAPKNPFLELKMFVSSSLGKVGNLFLSIPTLGQVFAVSPSELRDPSALKDKLSSVISI